MVVFQLDLDQTINVIQKENSTIAWKKRMFTDSPQHLLTSCRCWNPNEACTCIPILKWTSLSCAPSNQTHESIQFFHFMPMASSNITCALWGLCIKGDATKKRYHSGRADTEDLHIRPSPTSPSCRFVSCSHYLQLQYGTEMSNGAVFLNQPVLICKFECSFNLPASIKNA